MKTFSLTPQTRAGDGGISFPPSAFIWKSHACLSKLARSKYKIKGDQTTILHQPNENNK
jgi:hypothetical protein